MSQPKIGFHTLVKQSQKKRVRKVRKPKKNRKNTTEQKAFKNFSRVTGSVVKTKMKKRQSGRLEFVLNFSIFFFFLLYFLECL